jgi:hypothetical protein
MIINFAMDCTTTTYLQAFACDFTNGLRLALAKTNTPSTLLSLSLRCLYNTLRIRGVPSHAHQPHFTANHGQLNGPVIRQ